MPSDTNVILDAVLERADFQSAQGLIMAVASEQISGVVTANSVTDIYYIARKMVGDKGARRMAANVLSMFDIAAVDGEICAAALNVPMSDYEDAILAVCAAREGADYLAGQRMDVLAEKYFLSLKSIQRIVRQFKKENNK